MFASCNTPKRPRIRAKNIIEGKQSIAAKFASCNTPERPHIRAKKHKTRQAVHRCKVRQLQHPKKTAHSRKKHKTRQAVHRCNVRQLQHPKNTAHSRKKHNRRAVHRCKVRQLQHPKKTAHSRKKTKQADSPSLQSSPAATPQKDRAFAEKNHWWYQWWYDITDDISDDISVITTSSNHTRLVDFNASLLESPFALMKACCKLAETLVSIYFYNSWVKTFIIICPVGWFCNMLTEITVSSVLENLVRI